MKLSIIATEADNRHVLALRDAAVAQGLECDIHDIDDLNDLPACIARLGDVILWRSATLSAVARTVLLRLLKDKVVINEALADFPYAKFKLYQQKLLEDEAKLSTIPTYQFSTLAKLEAAIAGDVLRFPFITKPNLGACGRGVVLVENKEQLATLSMKDMVCQNFIANDGDYRVFMLGGKPLGVMKRTAAIGDFRNNVSQGGTAIAEHDPKIVAAVTAIAQRAVSMFGLQLCGVDVLRDTNGRYHFLEINSVPQWSGFQECTGIDVASEIVRYAIQMYERKQMTKTPAQLIADYIAPSIALSFRKAFHYNSRMYLWTGRDEYWSALAEVEEGIVGRKAVQQRAVFSSILARPLKTYAATATGRNQLLAQYPLLRRYELLLARTLFAKTIYKTRLLPALKATVDMDTLCEMRNTLLADPTLIVTLSTPAVNTLYFMQHLFGREYTVDPSVILDAVRALPVNKNRKALTERLYLFTHVIIAASAYYSKPITAHKNVYRALMKEAEHVIAENYWMLRLDAKLEFVVAARILGYHSVFSDLILQDAEHSLSKLGNYIVDKNIRESVRHHFLRAEHRNVLYLMAKEPWQFAPME